MAKVFNHVREVLTSPFYRTRPLEAARYAYSKWIFSKHRISDPIRFLTSHGIDIDVALEGFSTWRPILENVINRVRDVQGQHGGVSFEDGQVLYGVTRALKPECIIETGVAAGVSASFIGAALIENGKGTLYSIELPPEKSAVRVHGDGSTFDWPALGVGWAMPEGILKALGPRRVLILQDVRSALPKLLRVLPSVDVFFHDDLHVPDQMQWEYELVWPRLRPGGIMLSDDANYGWIQFAGKHALGKLAMLNVQRLTAIQKPNGSLVGAESH
jgi:hypothetical protein